MNIINGLFRMRRQFQGLRQGGHMLSILRPGQSRDQTPNMDSRVCDERCPCHQPWPASGLVADRRTWTYLWLLRPSL